MRKFHLVCAIGQYIGMVVSIIANQWLLVLWCSLWGIYSLNYFLTKEDD